MTTNFKKLIADAVAANKIRTTESLVREYYRIHEQEFQPMEFYPCLVECYEAKDKTMCVTFNGRPNLCAKYFIK